MVLYQWLTSFKLHYSNSSYKIVLKFYRWLVATSSSFSHNDECASVTRCGEKSTFPEEYITPELFRCWWRHCLLSTVFTFRFPLSFFVIFVLLASSIPYIYLTLPRTVTPYIVLLLPSYLTSHFALPYLTSYLTLPYFLPYLFPFVTLPSLTSYLTLPLSLCFTLPYRPSYLMFCLTLPYLLPYILPYLTLHFALPCLTWPLTLSQVCRT